jgi:chromosome segregation ATPase
LANLRSEHARLKDDFRSLFTSSDRVKTEYNNLQADYKALKANFNKQRLQSTEQQGQLHEIKEQMAMADVEHTKVLHRCEVLEQMNNSLEDDRQKLMNQVEMHHFS